MIDRIIRVFLGISCVVLAISWLTRPPPPAPVAVSDRGIVPPALIQAFAAEDELLGRRAGDVQLEDVDLPTAAASLGKQFRAKIDVNWRELKAAGIDRGTSIDLHLRNPTLRRALTELCEEAGGRFSKLEFEVKQDTVIISTVDILDEDPIAVAYNVRPLIDRLSGRVSLTPLEAADEVELLINSAIPRRWSNAGMTSSSRLGDLVVVTEPRQIQRKLATLLIRLDVELDK